MTHSNKTSHIIKHVNGVSTLGVVLRLIISASGITGYIMFNEFFFNQENLWLYVPINLLFIGLWVCWPIFDLLNWNKVECDTHHQKIIYKSLLRGTVELPFDSLFKIKVWKNEAAVNADYDMAADDIMKIPTAVSKIEFIGKEGDLIPVEGTNIFNHVINNYLNEVPLEIVDGDI